MKRKVFNFSLLASVSLLVFGVTGLSSCANSSVAVPRVKLEASTINMEVGDTKPIKLSVQKGYENYQQRWFTSNENVVHIINSSKGYVAAVGEGSATVTAAIAGAYVDCTVLVTDNGGDPSAARFTLSPTSVSIEEGKTAQLTWNVNPSSTTIAFSVDNSAVATVDEMGLITGVAAGSCVVTAVASNGLTRRCTVTVKGSGGEGGGGTDDIGVSSNLGYTGSLSVGAPEKQMAFMQELLRDFNRLTNSSIKFDVTQVEEGKGAAQFANAGAAPAIFPYASDQIVDFQNLGALTSLRTDNVKWIRDNMLPDALTAARVGTATLGYPFTSDNGVVMFYDGSVVTDPSSIDTFDELLQLASQKGLEVDFKLTEGFYAAGALHSYTKGKSLYTLTPTNTGYKSTANFNSEAGNKAIRVCYDLLTDDREVIRFGDGAPGTSGILATIVDTSYVQSFKTLMGNKYAVAPLPAVDNEGTRMGAYLGYKFYGVNQTLDNDSKTKAHDVAKFLVSAYSQTKRFNRFQSKPTITSLQAMVASEPHIAALNEQAKFNSTVLLTAAGSELWSATSKALNKIYEETFTPTDQNYTSVLQELDATLKVTK